jgi:hypothetical protein
MVQAFDKLWVGLVTYFLVIAGAISLGTQLLSVVAVNTIELAQPYLDSGMPRISLIEQRQIDSAVALPRSHYQERVHVVTIEAPSAAPAILAAQLDLAETNGLTTTLAETDAAVGPVSESASIAIAATKFRVTRSRVTRSHPEDPVVTTRDIFNRSFGVLTVAANTARRGRGRLLS